jgi:pyruvate dehydrogenase E2 component (dihydrolipoamide acetyltransferase)
MPTELKLPKLTETVDTVQINEVFVSPGQTVEKDQPLLVVNADKSNMEVYAPMAGKILQVPVKVGQELKVGGVYAVMEGNGAPQSSTPAAPTADKETRRQGDKETKRATDGQAKKQPEKEAAPAVSVPAEVKTAPARNDVLPGILPASPSTRWLARKLGVDLAHVRGSGPRGRILEEDVKASAALASPAAGPSIAVPPLPAFEKFGEVVREPLTNVRKLTAQKMGLSWSLIPHVTQHDQADITDLEAFRKQQEGKGVKLTVTAFVLKACAIALKQFPTFNSTLDLANNQLVLKKYYHIGMAVDTKNGLLVPVLRDVDKKGVEQLARELTEAAEKARAGKADMTGGTFTITNLGGIGGTSFTPIINHPEVAILGLSRSRLQPVVKDGQVVPRLLLPLSLSYDHRVIDGADGARFARRLAEMLENPWMMVMHG